MQYIYKAGKVAFLFTYMHNVALSSTGMEYVYADISWLPVIQETVTKVYAIIIWYFCHLSFLLLCCVHIEFILFAFFFFFCHKKLTQKTVVCLILYNLKKLELIFIISLHSVPLYMHNFPPNFNVDVTLLGSTLTTDNLCCILPGHLKSVNFQKYFSKHWSFTN